MNMHKKSKAEEIAMTMRAHSIKYGLPLKKIVKKQRLTGRNVGFEFE